MEVSETEMLTKNYLAANNLEMLHLNLDLHPNQKPTSVKANKTSPDKGNMLNWGGGRHAAQKIDRVAW